MRKLRSNMLTPIFLVIVVIGWELAVIGFEIPRFILPRPSFIIVRFISLFGTLMKHTTSTMSVALVGYGLGSAIGFLLAIVMTLFPAVRSAIYPLVLATQTTPKIAIAPLFILWFGVGSLPKVFIVALLAFFPILINTIVGLESADQSQIDLMRSVNASKWQIYRHIRFFTAVPHIFAGLKLALTVSIIGAIIAEWVASQKGLGFLLLLYNAELKTADLFAVLIALVILASLSFFTISFLERIFSWHSRIQQTQGAVIARDVESAL